MNDLLLEKLLSTAPEAIGMLGIIFLIAYVLREYRKIRLENEQSIKNIVNAKLGEIMSRIQTEISRLEIVSKDQELKLVQVNETYERFTSDIEEKTSLVNGLYRDAQEKLNTLREAIPNVDEYSARDLLGMARGHENAQTQAAFCNHVLDHQDATSHELEIAGDIMRRSNRYTLAMELYEKAYIKDPERLGAHIELLSLKAELEYSDRNRSLEKAKEMSIARPNVTGFARVSNALIELDRYEELIEFSDNFIISLGDRNPHLKALALRNKAVGKRELGAIPESIEAFNQAFSIRPEDENTLKPYLGLLEEQGKDEEYLVIARKLIDIDPSDVNYYRIYIAALIKRGMYRESGIWLRKTANLKKDQMDEATLSSYADMIDAAVNIAVDSDD